jgi:hypothetical protein
MTWNSSLAHIRLPASNRDCVGVALAANAVIDLIDAALCHNSLHRAGQWRIGASVGLRPMPRGDNPCVLAVEVVYGEALTGYKALSLIHCLRPSPRPAA